MNINVSKDKIYENDFIIETRCFAASVYSSLDAWFAIRLRFNQVPLQSETIKRYIDVSIL